METPPVNLNSQKLFQPHIAEVYFRAKMVQQRELAGLNGRFKHNRLKSKCCREPISEVVIEAARGIEEAYSASTLSGFHYQLDCACIQPSISLPD